MPPTGLGKTERDNLDWAHLGAELYGFIFRIVIVFIQILYALRNARATG
jgi:hypothetical protein